MTRVSRIPLMEEQVKSFSEKFPQIQVKLSAPDRARRFERLLTLVAGRHAARCHHDGSA